MLGGDPGQGTRILRDDPGSRDAAVSGMEMMEMLQKGGALPLPPVILMLIRPLDSNARLETERLGIAQTILKPIRLAGRSIAGVCQSAEE
jgi:hypothetical protein